MISLLAYCRPDIWDSKVETIVHIYDSYVCFDAVILSSSFSKQFSRVCHLPTQGLLTVSNAEIH